MLTRVVSEAVPVTTPAVHPACWNVPRVNDDGFEELCHLVAEQDPDTALCGRCAKRVSPSPAAR
jgi:hypothetical protein